VLSGIVFSALFGGVATGFLLRGSSQKNEVVPLAATPAPLPTSTSDGAFLSSGRGSEKLPESAVNNAPNPSAETGVPVENLAKETERGQLSHAPSVKGRTNGTITSGKKSGTKGTKRQHDFGF
jgi:hypothetical protein